MTMVVPHLFFHDDSQGDPSLQRGFDAPHMRQAPQNTGNLSSLAGMAAGQLDASFFNRNLDMQQLQQQQPQQQPQFNQFQMQRSNNIFDTRTDSILAAAMAANPSAYSFNHSTGGVDLSELLAMQQQQQQQQQQQLQQQAQRRPSLGMTGFMPNQQPQQQQQQLNNFLSAQSLYDQGSINQAPYKSPLDTLYDNAGMMFNPLQTQTSQSSQQQLQQQLGNMMFQQQQQQQQQQPVQTATPQPFFMGEVKRRESDLDGSLADRRVSLGHTALFAVQASELDKPARKEKKRRAKSFPEKLMQAMIDHAVDEDAVAWLPDGKSFVIVNADLFVSDVIGPVFKQCKYASFVRKLHRWGFVRLTSGTGTDCFHHPLFQKGRKDLTSKITCTPREKDGSLKGVGARLDKPPSLAGVERFIRARAAAVGTSALAPTMEAPSQGQEQQQQAHQSISC